MTARQQLFLGTVANDGTGNPLRNGGGTVNANFALCDIDTANLANATAGVAANSAAIASNTAAINTLLQQAPFPLLAGSISAAAANTLAIQTALTAGGMVNITQPGTFYINATLVYSSSTVLVLGPQTIIQAVPGMNATMLISSSAIAFLAGGTTVTLTQGTGTAVNVAWPAHGLSVGQGIWLFGSTPSTYNGVFRVAAVVDTNNVTIYTTQFATSAPSGTAKAVVAVQFFSLIGGTWNYDYPNNGASPNNYNVHAIGLYGLLDCYAEDVQAINANKFAFCLCAVASIRTRNLKVNNRSDGIKVYGPARGVVVDGLSGVSQDDFLSIQTTEPAAFQYAQISGGGDIYNVSVKNLDALPQLGGSVYRVYPSDSELCDLLTLDGVIGQANQVTIGNTAGSPFVHGYIGTVTMKNVGTTAKSTTTSNFLISNCTADIVTLEDCPFWPGSSLVAANDFLLSLSGTVVINQLILHRIKSDGLPSGASGALNIVNISSGVAATINKIIARDCQVTNSGLANGINLINIAGTAWSVGEFLIEGGYYDANSKYLVSLTGVPASGTPILIMRNVTNLGSGNFNISANMTVSCRFEGNTFGGQALGTLRTAATVTASLSSDGCNKFVNANLIIIVSGTLSTTLYGGDLRYDAGLLATTQGQHFYHSSVVAGRNSANQQGLCVASNGTNFYALATGSGGVNTLIV